MMRSLSALLGLLLCGPVAPAAPAIAEFMASNATTLKDGNGRYQDWIEIWNPDSTPVDLAGWRLTDDSGNLGKFVFPTKILPPGGRLVVMCSGRADSTGPQTHVDAAGYLHTNFSLAKSGEYLALLHPDGRTPASEFAPAYPEQVTDLSYGTRGSFEPLVDESSAVRYLVPTSTAADSAATPWRAHAYVDTSWKVGSGSGVGFEQGAPVGVWLFDESVGAPAAADASGSGHAAPLNGTGQTFGAAGHAPQSATAVEFSGVGGLTVPYSARLNPPAAFTFAAWVYPRGGSGYRTVVSSRSTTASLPFGYTLSLTPAGTWEFRTGNGTSWHLLASGPATLNTWSHLAITRSATGTKRLYINGVSAATASGGYAPNTDPDHGFHLGAGDDTGTSQSFTGALDDAAFFPADIGPLLVQQHRDQGAASFPSPLYPAHYQNDVQSAMAAVNPGIYTRHRFVLPDKSLVSALRLQVKYDDAFVAYLNGLEVARRNFAGTRAFNSVADTDRADSSAVVFESIDLPPAALAALTNGANTLAIHGLRRSLGHEDFLLTPLLEAAQVPAAQESGYFAQATPGLPNHSLTVLPGPAIEDLTHSPAEPVAGQTVTITARIRPRLAPIASVTATCRVMYTAESPPVAMTDIGPAPGTTDGSRLYAAEIPNCGGATAKRMLRYCVTATDTSARTWREPWPLDLSNADGVSQSPQYRGLVVKDPALTAGMPILQWFTQDISNSDTRTGSRASAYYAGKFYDNIYVRQRGGYTSAGSQKFNFNADHGLFVNQALGTVGEVNLNSSGVDPNGYRVAGSYDILRTSGQPACEAFQVAMFRNASFQRMAVLIEQVDEDYLQRRGFDPQGAMYKFVQRLGETPLAGGDYSNSPAFGDTLYGIEKKTRTREGLADLDDFVSGLTTGSAAAKKAHLFQNLNLPNFVNFMAMRPLLSDSDTNRKNFYFYRDSDGSREWFLFPWDKDGTMSGTIHPWQATLTYKAEASSTKQWNVLWEQGYQSLEIRAMVGRRLRTLMDSLMGPVGTPAGTSVLEQRMAAVRATMIPLPPGVTVSNYNNISSWTSWLSQNRTWLYTTYGPTSSANLIPAAASLTPQVVIHSADPNPASGNQDLEYLLIRNQGPEAVDLSGWTLSGGGIQHRFAVGTVLVGTAVSNSLNQAYVCNQRAAFRARPGAAVPEFVLGNYDGALTARGGTVELRQSNGALVSSFLLPTAPTLAQQQLRLTKLMYAPSPATLAELAARPTADAEDFEYLEIHNLGAVPLDLSGGRFTDGITFSFPPGSTLPAGARLALARNPAAFDQRYGTGLARLGPYEGALDNRGERLRLVDAVGEEVLDFTYDPSWYPSSDGQGYALVIRDDAAPDPANWTLPEKWALSGALGGAPTAAPDFFSQEYAGWTHTAFSPAERANPAISGPAVCHNPAALSNLMAFALQLDPRAPALAQLPQPATVVELGQSYPALRFRRWKNAPGLTYTLQVARTPDATAWETSEILRESTDHGDGTTTATLRAPLSLQQAPRQLLRLKVSLP